MYLGIDFGTCYSKVATAYLGQPVSLLPSGISGIPSEFYYDDEVGVLIGQDALDNGVDSNATNLVSEVKMKLGETFMPGGKEFSAQDIVREIYRNVIETGVETLKSQIYEEVIDGAVLTVPSKFTMQERALLREAAETCLGPDRPVPVTAVIKEPVAAALSYFSDSLASGTSVLVYDLGGGICDVALVTADDTIREHYAVRDSAMLRYGGRDFDRELSEYIVNHLEARVGTEIRGNAAHMEKIRRAAIEVKHKLSQPGCTVAPAIVEINGRSERIPIRRNTFEVITQEMLQRTVDLLEEVYENNIGQTKIEKIICAGGDSNMPMVRETIAKRFPSCEVLVFQPEHAVVNGAAICAEMIGPALYPLHDYAATVTDTADFSYGIRCFDDCDKDPNNLVIVNIIKKGTPLPAMGKHMFYPTKDRGQTVTLNIFESEYTEQYPADDPAKRAVGKLSLTWGDGFCPDTPIKCTMTLDRDGVLHVRAEDGGKQVCDAHFEPNSIHGR